MDAELRKRFEKAAKEIANKKFPGHRASENDRRSREDYQLCRDSCIIGIEHGFKEAIAICNDAIVDAANEFFGDYAQSCALANKVLDKMNKLLEEKK